MLPILKYLKALTRKMAATFEPKGFTLWGIHATDIVATMTYHPEAWTALHMAVTIAVFAKAVDWLKD